MVMITDPAQVCPATLEVTAQVTVPCVVPHPHGLNDVARYHQAAHGSRVYVWALADGEIIRVGRLVGQNDRADRYAASLVVVVTP